MDALATESQGSCDEGLVMLRVVLTLDCDHCRDSYWQAAVLTDPEPLMWESTAYELQSCAGSEGWKTPDCQLEGRVLCDVCADEEAGTEPEYWPDEVMQQVEKDEVA